jgi:hypothetical protein
MRGPQDDPSLRVRASDAEREHVAQLLGRAFAEGRLSTEEHSERLEAVYASKTRAELRPLLADLPVEFAASDSPQPSTVVPSGDDTVVAVFGEAKRTGRWLVRSGLTAKAVFGEVELDLTEAVLEQREITIFANAVFGEVVIRVPDGVVVHDEGSSVFGSRKLSAGPVQFGPETPVVHVKGYAVFGSVEAKRPKRKWLRSR